MVFSMVAEGGREENSSLMALIALKMPLPKLAAPFIISRHSSGLFLIAVVANSHLFTSRLQKARRNQMPSIYCDVRKESIAE
jgi:hypothetical protein